MALATKLISFLLLIGYCNGRQFKFTPGVIRQTISDAVIYTEIYNFSMFLTEADNVCRKNSSQYSEAGLDYIADTVLPQASQVISTHYEFAIPDTSPYRYFEIPHLVNCVHGENGITTLTVQIPLRPKGHDFSLLHVRPFWFSQGGKTCSVQIPEQFFIHDKLTLSVNALGNTNSEQCDVAKSPLCKLPITIGDKDSKLDCLSVLVRDADIGEIKRYCPYHCYSGRSIKRTEVTRLTHVFTKLSSVDEIWKNVAVQCGNHTNKHVLPSEWSSNGATKVTVACQCTLMDHQNITITQGPPCQHNIFIVPQFKTETLIPVQLLPSEFDEFKVAFEREDVYGISLEYGLPRGESDLGGANLSTILMREMIKNKKTCFEYFGICWPITSMFSK